MIGQGVFRKAASVVALLSLASCGASPECAPVQRSHGPFVLFPTYWAVPPQTTNSIEAIVEVAPVDSVAGVLAKRDAEIVAEFGDAKWKRECVRSTNVRLTRFRIHRVFAGTLDAKEFLVLHRANGIVQDFRLPPGRTTGVLVVRPDSVRLESSAAGRNFPESGPEWFLPSDGTKAEGPIMVVRSPEREGLRLEAATGGE